MANYSIAYKIVGLHLHQDLRYMGAQGIYSVTVPYERDPGCIVCSPGVTFEVHPAMTLQQPRAMCWQPPVRACAINAQRASCADVHASEFSDFTLQRDVNTTLKFVTGA
eukprot:762047-Pelagomonas_calceolata.AAC.2